MLRRQRGRVAHAIDFRHEPGAAAARDRQRRDVLRYVSAARRSSARHRPARSRQTRCRCRRIVRTAPSCAPGASITRVAGAPIAAMPRLSARTMQHGAGDRASVESPPAADRASTWPSDAVAPERTRPRPWRRAASTGQSRACARIRSSAIRVPQRIDQVQRRVGMASAYGAIRRHSRTDRARVACRRP